MQLFQELDQDHLKQKEDLSQELLEVKVSLQQRLLVIWKLIWNEEELRNANLVEITSFFVQFDYHMISSVLNELDT